MATQTEKLQDATKVLQQVDVSEIFTNLALGIAKAQEALDDNSIKQLKKLAQTEVAGKSLLELGFVPAFYQFDYADVSASISIQMRLSESFSLDFQAKLDFAQKRGYTKEDIDMVEKSKTETHRKEFKSSRDFLMKSSETKAIKVLSRTLTMDQQEGSVSKIKTFNQSLHEVEGVSRASHEIKSQYQASQQAVTTNNYNALVENLGGYVTIFVPPMTNTEDIGILKIATYGGGSPTSADIDASGTAAAAFPLTGTFDSVFAAAEGEHDNVAGGVIVGFSQNTWKWVDGGGVIHTDTLLVHFPWNVKEVDYSYTGDSVSAANNVTNNISLAIKTLGQVLKADPAAKVHLIGHADVSSTNTQENLNYNLKLGEDRAKKVKEQLIAAGASDSQITFETKGESEHAGILGSSPGSPRNPLYRKVEVKLKNAPDYIYFQGGAFKAAATPTLPDANGNGFKVIYNSATQFTSGGIGVKFDYNGTVVNLSSVTTAASAVAGANGTAIATAGFSHEVVNDVVYLLHEESTVHFTVYSSDLDEIEISEVTSSSSSSSNSESTYVIDETVTKDYTLVKDAETIKNPSTVAFGASIDMRMARSMDISMQGNSSMSARMRAVPPPDVFIDFIRSTFGGGE